MVERTKDGLFIVTEQTFMNFLQEYDITLPNNNPFVTERIKIENPQIYRILSIGMKEAPNNEARVYFEAGVQIAYELLRRQTLTDSGKP